MESLLDPTGTAGSRKRFLDAEKRLQIEACNLVQHNEEMFIDATEIQLLKSFDAKVCEDEIAIRKAKRHAKTTRGFNKSNQKHHFSCYTL